MARVKKPDMPPPPPKHPRECKHGCIDCKHYHLDVKAFPCCDCERWNYWEDAHPEKNNTIPFPPESISNFPVQDPTPSANEPKKRGRRTQIVAPQTDAPPVMPEQAPATPKKRGRKPKIDAIISGSLESEPVLSITEPVKRKKKSRQKADDAPDLPPPAKDQLSLF